MPGPIPGPGIYLGGDAARVENYLGLSGSQILYVGDHVFADVRMSKASLRWRTALILRELEEELQAIEEIRPIETELSRLMAREGGSRATAPRGPTRTPAPHPGLRPRGSDPTAEIQAELDDLWARMEALDQQVGSPGQDRPAEAFSSRWGTPLRSGYDISHLARQVERSADIYTSRVSNFLYATPFAYLRAKRGVDAARLG